MWKNKRILVGAVLAAVVVAAGVGGAAYAKAGGTVAGVTVLNQAANVSGNDSLMARVAKILGIDQQTLQDAVKQARGDMQNDRLNQYLQNLVDQGKITQPQADAFKAWWAAKPTGPETTIQQIQDWMAARPADVPLPRGFGGFGGCAPMMRGPVRGGPVQTAPQTIGPARGATFAPMMGGRF